MQRRGRRVYFEDEILQAELNTRRTRGGSRARSRSRSADRVHTIYDDVAAADMHGREQRVFGREAYDSLQRENQYLRIQLRELEDTQAWLAQLQRDNDVLQRENRELRRGGAVDHTSDANNATTANEESARKEHKLRKKVAKLEVEVSDLKTKASEWKAKASEWRKLYEDLRANHDKMRASLKDVERERDVQSRLAERYRDNLGAFQQENEALKRKLELEERLRRRHY